MMTVLHSDSKDDAEQSSVYLYNNNNEYLERLTHTGPKCLHTLYKRILSKFNAYNTHIHTDPPSPLLTHAPTAYIMAMGLKKKFLKRERFSRKI